MEENRKSKIGLIGKDGSANVLFEESREGTYITYNRGVEGLTFMPNNDLWYAFESGSSAGCDDTPYTIFRKMPFNPKLKTGYDFGKKPMEYTYEIDRCSCMDPTQEFGAVLGNGVSEILAFDENHLLVLERCYNKIEKGSKVKLFLATIDEKSGKLVKGTTVFDFNDPNNYSGDDLAKLPPDNLEGMTWGPEEVGKRMLYLVSDDNFNAPQRTQVFIMSVDSLK